MWRGARRIFNALCLYEAIVIPGSPPPFGLRRCPLRRPSRGRPALIGPGPAMERSAHRPRIYATSPGIVRPPGPVTFHPPFHPAEAPSQITGKYLTPVPTIVCTSPPRTQTAWEAIFQSAAHRFSVEPTALLADILERSLRPVAWKPLREDAMMRKRLERSIWS